MNIASKTDNKRTDLSPEYLVLWNGVTEQISDLRKTVAELNGQIESLEDLQKVAEELYVNRCEDDNNNFLSPTT